MMLTRLGPWCACLAAITVASPAMPQDEAFRVAFDPPSGSALPGSQVSITVSINPNFAPPEGVQCTLRVSVTLGDSVLLDEGRSTVQAGADYHFALLAPAAGTYKVIVQLVCESLFGVGIAPIERQFDYVVVATTARAKAALLQALNDIISLVVPFSGLEAEPILADGANAVFKGWSRVLTDEMTRQEVEEIVIAARVAFWLWLAKAREAEPVRKALEQAAEHCTLAALTQATVLAGTNSWDVFGVAGYRGGRGQVEWEGLMHLNPRPRRFFKEVVWRSTRTSNDPRYFENPRGDQGEDHWEYFFRRPPKASGVVHLTIGYQIGVVSVAVDRVNQGFTCFSFHTSEDGWPPKR